MEPQFRAAAGAAAWQVSNPPILVGRAAASPRWRSSPQAGMERLRAKSVALTGFWTPCCDRSRPTVRDHHPARQPRERGCQLSLRIAGGAARGRRVFDALRARGMVVRLALAGHHPRGAGAALQPLRGRAGTSRRQLQRGAARSARERPAARAVNIVGAGLAGALLALLLARRGLRVDLFERRADPRQAQPERGRSINLALAARGMRALERAGVLERVRPLLIAMRGRMVHELSGGAALQPYGQREHEVIYSVGRADLNRVLIEAAARHASVQRALQPAVSGRGPAA